MLWMSFGFRSAIGLTGLSWLDALPPAAAAVMAFMLLPIASFAITTPSTTISGSTPALIVVTPRRLIWPPPPGAPEFICTSAPGILPCSALSSVCVGARTSWSAFTTVTAFARLRCSTPVAWPVTTTASRLNTSCSRLTCTVLWSDGTSTRWCLNPLLRIDRDTPPPPQGRPRTDPRPDRGKDHRTRQREQAGHEHAGQPDLAARDLQPHRGHDEQNRQRREDGEPGNPERQAERAPQRGLGAPQLQQRRELERQCRGVQQHIARQETPQRNEREPRVHHSP